MIITAFVYLVYEEWRIACVTLEFLGMAVVSGPTSLAGDNAAETQRHVTMGVSLLGEYTPTTTTATTTQEGCDVDIEQGLQKEEKDTSTTSQHQPVLLVVSQIQKHEDQVLKLMKQSLFKRAFYTGSVETFITYCSTFLTAIVVITMSWGDFSMDKWNSSDFTKTSYQTFWCHQEISETNCVTQTCQ